MTPGKYAGYCEAPAGYSIDHNSPEFADWRAAMTGRCNHERLQSVAAAAALIVLPGWWKLLSIPIYYFLRHGYLSDACKELAFAAEEDAMARKGYWRC